MPLLLRPHFRGISAAFTCGRFLPFGNNVIKANYSVFKGSIPWRTCGHTGSRITTVSLRCTSTTVTAKAQSVYEEAKPFNEVPASLGLPLVGNLFSAMKYLNGRMYRYMDTLHEQYGSIYRMRLPGLNFLMINNPDDIASLMRQESEYPERMEFTPFVHYRKMRDLQMGVFLANGEDWHRQRKVVNKYLLKPANIGSYNSVLNKTARQLIKNMTHAQSLEGRGEFVPNVQEHLFRWSLESICAVLYDKELGCLADGLDRETEAFVFNTHDLFKMSEKLFMLPMRYSKLFYRKHYKRFVKATDIVFAIAKRHIDEKMDDVIDKAFKSKESSGLLAFLVKEELPTDEVYATVTDLMTAAVDTTSTSVQWALYMLSKHPEVQAVVHKELSSVLPAEGDTDVTNEHLQNLPYLRSVVKETQRLYPPTVGSSRITKSDLIIGGYHVPKGTIVFFSTYNTGRNPKHFKNADSFEPARWLRKTGAASEINPFTSLPFGFGVRSCVGRRLAELEIHLLLAQLLRKYKIYPGLAKDVNIKQILLMYPDKSVDVKLQPHS